MTATGTDSAAPPRRSVALTGRSRPLDPRTDAVRPDVADIRLAGRVFAPHYAEPVRRVLAADTVLRAARGTDAEAMAPLRAGDAFDLLDVTGDAAWGIAIAAGLVGYLDAAVLAPVTRA